MSRVKAIVTVFILSTAMSMPVFAKRGGKPSYFSGMLIVKFKSQSNSSLLQFKTSTITPQKRVQNYLNHYGLDKFQTMWKPSYRQHVLTALQQRKLPLSNFSKVKSSLSRMYEIHYSSHINAKVLAAKLSHIQGVQYAVPVYLRKVTFIPNDPYVQDSAQDYQFLKYQKFFSAWNVSQGDTSVVIGIVDTGVDYNDADLKNKRAGQGYDFWQSGDPSNGTVKEDNNPMADYSDHGTHVAGIATAQVNNKIGIAGTGYHCRYLPVKVGGTKDYPNTIGFGFKGIVYAAMHGANIINCSWGGEGYSQAEQDIINSVTKMGVLVVAAAGNDNSNSKFYPADYNNVLAVGSIDTTGIKSNFSNYGHSIDVMANGRHVLSTIRNNEYATMSGTSMAAPMVSGLAGLIKSLHPGWSAYRIAAQIRSTAVNVNSTNPDYIDQLGHGVIDAYKAVTTTVPGLKVISYSFKNSSGNKLDIGQSGIVDLKVANYDAPTKNATFTLRCKQANITISDSTVSKGVINTNDTVQVDFPITIGTKYPPTQTPEFRLGMTDPSYNYSDFHYFSYKGLLYDVTQVNHIQMSFSSDGSIGYMDPYDAGNAGGIGFNVLDTVNNKYTGNYLFSSGLMISDFHEIADNVRAQDSLDHGFKPLTTYRVKQPGTVSQADGSASFNTSSTPNFPLMHIQMQTYAFTQKDIDQTVFLKYTITNESNVTATPVYVGLHNDWDLGNADNNNTGYDKQDSLLYVYDPQDTTQPYLAVAQMGNVASNLAINNGYTGTENRYHFSIYYDPSTPGYNGYTKEEKFYSLMDGDSVTVIKNADVSAATASGPYVIKPGGQIVVGFIFAYGNTLKQLESQVRAARAKNLFQVNSNDIPLAINKSTASSQLPKETKLLGNYPNPFNPTTQIRFELSKTSKVDLSVYNILGQKVATLINGERQAGHYTITFAADKLSSGIYFSVLKTPSGIHTRKMMLIK